MILKKINTNNYSNLDNVNCLLYEPKKISDIYKIINFAKKKNYKLLCTGSSLSWYDTVCNEKNIIINLNKFEKKLLVDERKKILIATSNYKIKDLNKFLLKKKLALHAVPGSEDVTLGGCIGHDVHGKDTFKYGNFSENIIELTIITSKRKILKISRKNYPNFFKAICGGLGLLGVITEVKIKLKKVPEIYKTEIIKCNNYREIYKTLYKNINKYEYIYSWIDCSSTKSSIGKGIVFKTKKTNQNFQKKKDWFKDNVAKKLKFIFISILLKCNFIKLINNIFWILTKNKLLFQTYDEINYPIKHHNIDIKKIIYPYSFVEIQIILKKNSLPHSLYKFLNKCQDLDLIGFMVGLKIHKKNRNFISFNDDGLSININQILYKERKIEILNKLKILHDYCIENKNKIYICKDFYLKKKEILKIYPNVKNFLFYKKKIDPYNLFQSDFSRRCEL